MRQRWLSRRGLWISLVLPAVLVIVATTQIVSAHVFDVTSWKGGGFGMFANIDGLRERQVSVEVEFSDGTVADMPHSAAAVLTGWSFQSNRSASAPTRMFMNVMADRILSRSWPVDTSEDGFIITTPDDEGDLVRELLPENFLFGGDEKEPVAVTIIVSTLRFDSDTLEVERVLVASERFEK